MTQDELIKIMEVSGLSKNAIEKRLKMGQGTLGKFLAGKLRAIPDKYVKGIRKLGVIRPDIAIGKVTEVPFMDIRDADTTPWPEEKYQNKIADLVKLPQTDIKVLDQSVQIGQPGLSVYTEESNKLLNAKTVDEFNKAFLTTDQPIKGTMGIAIPDGVTVKYTEIEPEKKIKRPDNSLFHLLPKI